MKKEYDPRMHSAEHLLNQTMVRMFGCGRCFSAMLSGFPIQRALTPSGLSGWGITTPVPA